MNKKSLTEVDIRSKFITPAPTGPGGLERNVMTQIAAARATAKNFLESLVAELTETR